MHSQSRLSWTTFWNYQHQKKKYIYIYIHILGHGYLELHFEKSGLFERKGRLSKWVIH